MSSNFFEVYLLSYWEDSTADTPRKKKRSSLRMHQPFKVMKYFEGSKTGCLLILVEELDQQVRQNLRELRDRGSHKLNCTLQLLIENKQVIEIIGVIFTTNQPRHMPFGVYHKLCS